MQAIINLFCKCGIPYVLFEETTQIITAVFKSYMHKIQMYLKFLKINNIIVSFKACELLVFI